MASHVPVIAILMIVQGVLEILMGLFLSVMAFVIPSMLAEMQRGGRGGGFAGPGLPEGFQEMATVIYLGMGACGLVAGLLHTVAGIRNLSYRGRTLGLVALFGGILSVGTCYCSPTAIGVLIYGAIVYFNEQTARAFAMGEQGLSVAEIKERLRYGPDDRPPERGPDLPPRPGDEDEDWFSRKK
jgi:hypothetical protein